MLASSVDSAIADIPKVKHIIVVVQENRTPDNLFHGLRNYLPDADIANEGRDSKGSVIELRPVALANKYDLGHEHADFEAMYDHGAMDGADLTACSTVDNRTPCPANPQYRYVNPEEVAPYRQIAIQYGFANRMFQSNQGPSFPAHQFLISGTSAPTANSPDFAAENPEHAPRDRSGCISPSSETVNVLSPDGRERRKIYPCFEHKTLMDILDANRVSWRYYTPSMGSIWTGPAAIRHMCRPAGSPLRCTGPDWDKNRKLDLTSSDVLLDIDRKQLQSVSWVVPPGAYSDHARVNRGEGPSWVASIVNAVGQSEYWKDTVILVTWDDWGGWYDHVAPPIDPLYGYYEMGFRVPLLVISPYTPAGYVSNEMHSTGSILKFIETVFGLPVIPPGTYTDSRSDDLSDFFDFSAPPRAFVNISAPLGASYFTHDHRPATDPDND